MVFRKPDGNTFPEQRFLALVRLDSSRLDSQPLEAMACSRPMHGSLPGINHLVALQAAAVGRTAPLGTIGHGRNSWPSHAFLGQDRVPAVLQTEEASLRVIFHIERVLMWNSLWLPGMLPLRRRLIEMP